MNRTSMAPSSNVDLQELRIFLVLAEELHFARTAERIGITPSRVSQSLRSLERKLDAQLVYRTSRRVELTSLGMRLRERLLPVHEALLEALEDVRRAARHPIGLLRIGFTQTTVEKITPIVEDFEAKYADCRVELHEVSIVDPYDSLRRGRIDVLVNWLVVDEPDLTAGPVIARLDRVVAVAAHHRLATRASVSAEDLADYPVRVNPPGVPRALYEAMIPLRTPSGRPIPRAGPTQEYSVHELVAEIARGDIVHPTVDVPPFRGHDSIVLVPIDGLPPMELGLIRPTAREDVLVRALVEHVRATEP